MDLERLRDERVVSFLLRVMADPGESSEIRIHVLKRLRSGRLTAERAGPTPECVNLLRQLSNDEILGCSARSALARRRLKQLD